MLKGYNRPDVKVDTDLRISMQKVGVRAINVSAIRKSQQNIGDSLLDSLRCKFILRVLKLREGGRLFLRCDPWFATIGLEMIN